MLLPVAIGKEDETKEEVGAASAGSHLIIASSGVP